ncbi:MAG: DUF1294 domain-containing protein [Lachnospiraceae bacterium]|jgi:uncharacterized membrane protein YsdA (DUF1294 family)|nr:DUF1294 domain-containing protein [Lachnospiraceae bacterium]
MNDVLIYIFSYLFLINLFAFFLMGIDKLKAKQRGFRIPEATIFTVVVFGGSVGAWLGMYYFHHKTKRWYFFYGIPTIFALQVIGVLALLYYYEPTIF